MTFLASASPADFELFSYRGAVFSLGVSLTLALIYAIFTVVYNVYFHPLKHIPGPFWAKACGIPYGLHMRNGTMVRWVEESHKKYGEVVRLAPNEVSFISGETAWQDIYGFRTGEKKGRGQFQKDETWYIKPINGSLSLFLSDDAGHSRIRRNLAHAFSDKALRSQENLLQFYVNLLVQRIGEQTAESKDIDIVTWWNYLTFDVISDLTFGAPLNCLRDSAKHSWVSIAFGSISAVGEHAARNKHFLFKFTDALLGFFQDNESSTRDRKEFYMRAREQVDKRLAKIESGEDEERSDFFSHIVKNQEKEASKLTRAEMDSNAVSLLIAGSETTATTLSGATYLLLKNPSVYKKLVAEIRSSFSSADEITMEEVNKLQYLVAVFQESLRMYPPIPTGFPRVVHEGGDTISGYYIPGGTAVYCSQHAMCHSERNYKDAERYVPERWLGEERYKDDKRAAWNAFSFGPRNCIGKNLALAEMRIALAKVLFAFDMELVDKERDWMGEQKVFTLWQKDSLMVRFKPVQRP